MLKIVEKKVGQFLILILKKLLKNWSYITRSKKIQKKCYRKHDIWLKEKVTRQQKSTFKALVFTS